MPVYHVTYLHRLANIRAHGLIPGAGQTFGGGYATYSEGWLFVTEFEAVAYWANKLEQHAEANTDNPEEGWVPVVLAFDRDLITAEKDTEGTRDALADAWKTRNSVPPEELYLWDGSEWIDPENADPEAMIEDSKGEQIEEDGEEWWEVEWELFARPDELEFEEEG